MGERKGTNKYYPPDFDPKIHKSLNGYHGTHALRERARKLDRGILIIRFEMPYNIWCDGCKAHIAMGVRYNAEKTKVGMYYTTPIYQFRMKCHLCDMHFEIKTDPQNQDYVIISGARRKEQRWNMAENEQILTEDKGDIKRLSTDPMFKLEHDKVDLNKIVKLIPTINELEETKLQWKDDFYLNSIMRNKLRNEKKLYLEEKSKDDEFSKRLNLSIDLVREKDEDVKLASLFKFYPIKDDQNDDMANQQIKRRKIEEESIFDGVSTTKRSKSLSSINSRISTNSKEVKIENLRKKLRKSIQEKKLNNLVISSPIIDSKKSLTFEVNNKNTDKIVDKDDNNKVNKLVIPKNKINNNHSVDNSSDKKLSGLVSAQYGDSEDSNS